MELVVEIWEMLKLHAPAFMRIDDSNLFANYRLELYCAQVQLDYKTNLKIVLNIDSFMNRTEVESSFFRTEHRVIIERINSFTTLRITNRN